MRKLLILIIPILLASCVTRKACERKFPPFTRVSDSVVITEKLIKHDTTIYQVVEIPSLHIRDSVVVRPVDGQPVYIPKLTLKGRYSVANAWISNNMLKGTLDEGGMVKLSYWLTYYEKRVTQLKKSSDTKAVTVYKTRTWWKIWGWVGMGLTALILLAIADVIRFKIKRFTL